jgi:hypothetical protein
LPGSVLRRQRRAFCAHYLVDACFLSKGKLLLEDVAASMLPEVCMAATICKMRRRLRFMPTTTALLHHLAT